MKYFNQVTLKSTKLKLTFIHLNLKVLIFKSYITNINHPTCRKAKKDNVRCIRTNKVRFNNPGFLKQKSEIIKHIGAWVAIETNCYAFFVNLVMPGILKYLHCGISNFFPTSFTYTA